VRCFARSHSPLHVTCHCTQSTSCVAVCVAWQSFARLEVKKSKQARYLGLRAEAPAGFEAFVLPASTRVPYLLLTTSMKLDNARCVAALSLSLLGSTQLVPRLPW
jgi:hypothetical protein